MIQINPSNLVCNLAIVMNKLAYSASDYNTDYNTLNTGTNTGVTNRGDFLLGSGIFDPMSNSKNTSADVNAASQKIKQQRQAKVVPKRTAFMPAPKVGAFNKASSVNRVDFLLNKLIN